MNPTMIPRINFFMCGAPPDCSIHSDSIDDKLKLPIVFHHASKGPHMSRKIFVFSTLALALGSLSVAQTADSRMAQDTKSSPPGIACRVMEVFGADRASVHAIIFHRRDKADGPRLGESLLKHSGEEIEFETTDGERHRADVFRVKSCFGRGLLLL